MRLAVFLWIAVSCGAQQAGDFAGTWILRFHGRSYMKLTLTLQEGRLKGSFTEPSKITMDQDGDITEVGGELATSSVEGGELKQGRLQLKIDDDRFEMTLQSPTQASLGMQVVGIRPWKLERVAGGNAVILATSLPEPEYSPEIRALRERLSAMVKEDRDARMAFDNARIHVADAKDRPAVLEIFEKYGWVTVSLAGKDAAHNFWLLVQHQTPEIQQRTLPALEKAAKSGDASMNDYAFLYDRVQVGLGKPQHWATQTKCLDGKPVLWPVDDPAGLDSRRKELALPPVDEYMKLDYLAKACAQMAK